MIMHPIYITLISIGSALLFLFILWLFLVKPGRRRAEMEKFKKIKYAHRGLHNERMPENSLAAFRAAVSAGFGIELDVRLTSDGELVVFHDDTLDRMTGESGRVDARTLSELKMIRLGNSDEKIPTFKEVLELVAGRVPLLVELKEDAGKYGVTEKAVELLRDYKGEFIIESFNPLAMGRVKKLMPEVLRGFLSENFVSQKKYRKPMYFVLQHQLLNFVCRPDFIAYRHNDYSNGSLKFVRRAFGAATLAWTVRSKEEEREAYSHGFDGVIFEGYLPDKK